MKQKGSTSPRTYRPHAYWTDLHRRADLSSVGQSGLPAELNAWLYRNGARNLDRFLRRHWAPVPQRVFDAGAGSGYWVDFWLERGAGTVDGCDLVESAVDRLERRYPGRFLVADVQDLEPPEDPYDLVSCMNVLLHITDDRAFERALERLAGFVGPRGALLLSEPIVSGPARAYRPGTSSRVRTLGAYRTPLERAGLRLAAIEPTTVIGANPIERRGVADRMIWPLAWSVVTLFSRRGRVIADVVGRVIFAIDPVLLAFTRGPSGKFALFVRDPDR